MGYQSLTEIVETAEKEKQEFWEAVIAEECECAGIQRPDAFEKMQGFYQAMKAADEAYNGELRSASGLSGGDGCKMEAYRQQRVTLCGGFVSQVMEKAIKMAESNACMRRIVAAPTAGASGAVPAVLLTYQKTYGSSDEQMTKALYTAGGIGEVIAARASISGAVGGCQAEIGSSSAMAAGALVYLQKGSSAAVVHAAALALKNLLGLTCDPVAGLVEIPCIKRNALGAVNALSSADMALAGIRSAIPPDEVIDTMREIGEAMPADLKETGRGGLAATPTGREIAAKFLEER